MSIRTQANCNRSANDEWLLECEPLFRRMAALAGTIAATDAAIEAGERMKGNQHDRG